MIYTLILTAFLRAYTTNMTAVHIEHDYPTEEACQAAYKIAAEQLKEETLSVVGTCLKVK
jgi:hypothetical protein